MSNNNIPDGSVVVVASGAEAKFFRAHAQGDGLSLQADGRLEPTDLNDDGPSGKRPPDMPKQEMDEATFAKQLAHHLYDLAYNKDEKTFVLAVDPDTLGELRPILHQEVTEKVVLEIPKTLIGHPTPDIAKIVANAS